MIWYKRVYGVGAVEYKVYKVEAMEAHPQNIHRESENRIFLGGSLHRLHHLYYILIARCWLLFIPYRL